MEFALALIVGVALGWFIGSLGQDSLFASATRQTGHNSFERRRAARDLAEAPEATEWLIVLLADPTAVSFMKDPAPLTEEMKEAIAPFDLAVVAAAIEAVPEHASPAVLWALTTRLDEERIGRYGGQAGILKPRINAVTEPIRELARRALVRSLAVDHGYDVQRWREEIQQRAK